MKNFGFILLVVGFLAGAYATALDVQNVNWMLFTIAAIAAIVGLAISKNQASAHARSDAVLEVNRGELRESLQNIVSDLGEIVNDGATKGTASADGYDGEAATYLEKAVRQFADAQKQLLDAAQASA
jgi:hypothetical protein